MSESEDIATIFLDKKDSLARILKLKNRLYIIKENKILGSIFFTHDHYLDEVRKLVDTLNCKKGLVFNKSYKQETFLDLDLRKKTKKILARFLKRMWQ